MSSTHRAYLGEGYHVTVQHCEGPGCDAYLGTNYPSNFCSDCMARRAPVVTACGCRLEDGTCMMHRDGSDHRHCTTCGVPVFFDDEAVAYDDHECPPGFLLNPRD